jgi:hypothetical protein
MAQVRKYKPKHFALLEAESFESLAAKAFPEKDRYQPVRIICANLRWGGLAYIAKASCSGQYRALTIAPIRA